MPWSDAQVVEWLGTKGWYLEKDRRVRRSFVRFSRKRERQDQPRFMCGSHESVSDSTFWTNHVQHQNMNEQVIQIIVHHSRY